MIFDNSVPPKPKMPKMPKIKPVKLQPMDKYLKLRQMIQTRQIKPTGGQ